MQAPYTGFERVYKRELPFVWAAARRFGVHPAVIDDAVQDVFLTAYRRWNDLHYEVSPRAWLYGVTRRVAFRYRRSAARTQRRKAAVAQGGVARSTMPQAERDGARDVDAVLAALDPTQREVFVMAELLDMSGPEIAAELEIPLNTVYSRLRLARRQLERRVLRGEVGAWAAAVRRRDEPPPEQAQRGWALLVPVLRVQPGPWVGVLGAASTGKVLGGLVAVALVGAVAIGGWLGRDRDRGRDEGDGVSSVSVRQPGRDSGPQSRSAPVERAAAEPASAVVEAAAISGEAVEPAAAVEPAEAERAASSSSSPSPSQAQSAPAPAAPSSTLEAEVAVLDRATEALRSDDAARALQWLAEHEQRFPHGRLADVRKATRVRVLCRLGRDAQARTEAAALRREHPGSAVARKVPESCAEA